MQDRWEVVVDGWTHYVSFQTKYAATQLAAECRQEDAARSRSALLVFCFMAFPDRLALLNELRITASQHSNSPHPNLGLIEWLIECLGEAAQVTA